MKWREVFMSAQQRQSRRWEEEAKQARAFDQGKKMGAAIVGIIDDFYNSRAVPFYKDLCDVYRQRMLITHTANDTEFTREYIAFVDEIAKIKNELPNQIYSALGDWKYTIIQTGMKDDYDRLISSKVQTITDVMNEVATTEMMLAAARVRGKMTAEEYAMGPEKFRLHREHTQTEPASGTAPVSHATAAASTRDT